MPSRPSSAVLGLAALALVASGCSSSEVRGTAVADAAASLAPTASATATAGPSATATPEPTPSSTPSATPSASPAAAAPKAPTFDVAAVQRTLTEHKYYRGAIDGRSGPALRSAVMAFQKVHGLGADGAVGPATLAALESPKAPTLKATSPAHRVEVDLTKQVLYVVRGGAVQGILPVSSGNGASYKQKDGSTARALTPVGWYKIQRRIVGERHADLGTLYDPQYFYKGWAIHGSNSVPAGPASHGCVRVTRTDAKWLLNAIGNGTSLYLYGGTHTFTAGSSAPGTDTPTGDGAPAAPAPTRPVATSSAPAPTRPATTAPKPAPTTAPPTASPTPAPTSPATATPSATPTP